MLYGAQKWVNQYDMQAHNRGSNAGRDKEDKE